MKFKNWLYKEGKIQLPPKILWITGLYSFGGGPRLLNSLGYDCKQVSSIPNLSAAYLGRFKRYSFIKYFIQKKAEELGKNHLLDNIKKHDEEVGGEYNPNVIIGSSQGGAIAMELGDRYPKSKFVLASPAWKIFGANPENLPKDTIIIHGTKDLTVPFEDSEELSEKYGFRLIPYNGGHHNRPSSLLKRVIDEQLLKLGISPPNTQLRKEKL